MVFRSVGLGFSVNFMRYVLLSGSNIVAKSRISRIGAPVRKEVKNAFSRN